MKKDVKTSRGPQQRAAAFLKAHPNQRFTARQIAQALVESDPVWVERRLREGKQVHIKTPADLVPQISAELYAPAMKKRFSQLRVETAQRPRLFYWSGETAEEEVERAEKASPVQPAGGEATLYAPLVVALEGQFGVRARRIDEKRSKNTQGSRGNHWLFPDVVGYKSLMTDLPRDLREAMKENGAARAQLWSCEVKVLLNRSNVREAYFQAVSNSTWANSAWLVTQDIEGDGTYKELLMLNALHGVGVLKLDRENPLESQVLIPAQERAEIGWDMCGRLAEENSDFAKFVLAFRNFLLTDGT